MLFILVARHYDGNCGAWLAQATTAIFWVTYIICKQNCDELHSITICKIRITPCKILYMLTKNIFKRSGDFSSITEMKNSVISESPFEKCEIGEQESIFSVIVFKLFFFNAVCQYIF